MQLPEKYIDIYNSDSCKYSPNVKKFVKVVIVKDNDFVNIGVSETHNLPLIVANSILNGCVGEHLAVSTPNDVEALSAIIDLTFKTFNIFCNISVISKVVEKVVENA